MAPDEVKPGEIAESPQTYFGLAIPRKMRVTKETTDVVTASGPLGLEQVANFVKERVDAKQVETGPTKTVFIDATTEGAPNARLTIEVSRLGPRTTLTIRNKEGKAKIEPGLTEEQRWNRVGLTKDGKIAEPNKFE